MMRRLHQFLTGTTRGRLLLAMAAVYGLLSLLVVELTLRQRDIIHQRHVDEAAIMARTLASSAAGWIAASDVAGLQELVEGQRGNPGTVFALITDSQGRVLADTDPAHRGLYVLDLPPTPQPYVFTASHSLVDVATPAILAGRPVGWARVGIGHEAVAAEVNELIRTAVYFSLAALIVGMLVTWLILRLALRRLDSVKQTIDAVRAGDPLARSGLTGHDEVAVIAREFNAMLDGLQDRDRELRASEERFRSLIQNVQAGIVVHDAQGAIVTANPVAAELLGMSLDQLFAKEARDPEWHFLRENGTVLPLDEYPVNRVLATRAPVRGLMAGVRRPGRDTAWLLVNAEPALDRNGNIIQVIISFVDVAERRRAEEAIREAMQRYRMVFESSPVSLWEEDFSLVRAYFDRLRRDGVTDLAAWLDERPERAQELAAMARIVDVNHAALTLHGAATKEELLSGLVQTLTPESFDTFREELICLWNGETEMRRDARVKTLAGEPREVTVHFSVVPDAQGSLARVVVSLVDITERKRSERERALLGFSLDRVNELVGLLDGQARFRYVNEGAVRALGYSTDELLGMSILDLTPTWSQDTWRQHWTSLRATGSLTFENVLRRKDGTVFPVEVSTNHFEFGGESYNLALGRDITERKAAETALLRLNRELRAISDCNQALVRAEDEASLLHNICRIVCEEAGYMMAWVGFAEEERPIEPAAWFGAGSDLFRGTAAGIPPSVTAFRTASTVTVQSIAGDPAIPSPGREAALQQGYRSMISIPLRGQRDKVFGIIGIFAAEEAAFTADETRLMEELAADLAFGISALRIRAERNHMEAIVAARLRLIQFSATHTLEELLEETLNETERLTGSAIGFYHFIEDDEQTVCLQNWSTRTKAEFCKAEGKGSHYPVSQGGVWTDAVRLRKPVVHNDYASLPHRKGMPPGHATVTRECLVPVFRGNRLVAILGVGNKPSYYTDTDLDTVSLLADQAFEIAERKRAEEQLHQYQNQLEETVEQRTAELLLARDAAQAANKAKSLFLANMSHELRTPLNAILGFSSLMRRDPDLPPHQRESLDIINRSGEHLLTLINDVLEMAKIEAGRLQLEVAPFDLGAMVREVAEMMRLRAVEKGLTLELQQAPDVPTYIRGDEARLRQILINLVSNAVKFTSAGGVVIRLAVGAERRDRLRIEVEDTGPGISAADQRRLFEPFVQLTESGARQGTGLGLSITRQFVQLMGGTIGLESTVGKGSLFRVELPVEWAAATELAHSAQPPQGKIIGLAPGQPRYRILVAEDHYENQVLLSRLMSDIGLEVRAVPDGEQCVTVFRDWKPDLIWMDKAMPVLDGLEATRRIRALPEGKEVKIVAVTASAFKEQQGELLAAGMDAFVRKPYRAHEIYDCLAEQLHLRYARAPLGEEEQAIPARLEPRLLAALPVNLRQELREGVERLDSSRIMATLQQIRAVDPALGRLLARLAEDFDYPSLLAALDEAKEQ